ncbi:hypothetical protein Tco_0048510, partial [Tanacetum coccineum]
AWKCRDPQAICLNDVGGSPAKDESE